MNATAPAIALAFTDIWITSRMVDADPMEILIWTPSSQRTVIRFIFAGNIAIGDVQRDP